MSTSNGSVRCFTSKDAPQGHLKGERVAVLGYGNLGRTFALNLRDSIADSPVIGNIEDSYAKQARAEGFTVLPIADAVAKSDVILVLLPDEVIPEVFAADIAPHLVPGSAILFGSGYPLAYDQISVPPGIDVLMLAPRMAGETARQRFVENRGFYAFVSVEQDASGKAWQRLLGVADGVGVLRAGALELDAHREAYLDLFLEQTLGAVMGTTIMSAFSMGVEAGLPPEVMVLEMYMSEEIELAFRAFREQGFFTTSSVHGPTAIFGGYVRMMEFMGSNLVEMFRHTYEEVYNGEFARKFAAERKAGYPALKMAEAFQSEDNPQNQAEVRLRALLAGESSAK
jgi:ketol-acid reductoisomerase